VTQISIWHEQKPSRLSVAYVYAKRISRWRRNSEPFLSGDLFADKSDISVFPPKYRGQQPSIRDIKEALVIFCPSNRLQEFLDLHRNNINAKVIIAGNSDFDFHELPSGIPKSVRQLFLQNSFISDSDLVTTLPIGIENLRWGVNGHPRLMKKDKNWSLRNNMLLMGPFGLTHSERYNLPYLFSNDPNIKLVENRISPKLYSQLTNDYRYVAAVRGNGVDTHRFWESLYRGAMPVVKITKWSQSLRSFDLPFVEIRDWVPDDIYSIFSDTVSRDFNPSEIDSLWWPFWKNQIIRYL